MNVLLAPPPVSPSQLPADMGHGWFTRAEAADLAWQFLACIFFLFLSHARGMVQVVADANNIGLGATALQLLLHTNLRLLPPALRPLWIKIIVLSMCAVFYLGLTALVTIQKPISLCYFGFFVIWVVLWWVFSGPAVRRGRADASDDPPPPNPHADEQE